MLDVEIVAVSPTSREAAQLMTELDAEIQRRYPGVTAHGLHQRDLDDPRTVFLVARVAGESCACGALRALEPGTAEVKRMYVRDQFRRLGLGRRMIAALESTARGKGITRLRLETGVAQPEAIALYESVGFAAVEPYGEYIGNDFSRCFEKTIA